MVNSIRLWARYNLATDEKVQGLLTSLGPEAYVAPRNTYFKTLAALHLHYAQTYKFYQTMMRKNSDNRFFISPLTEEGAEWKGSTLEEVCRTTLEYDKLYLTFSEAVTDADLECFKTKRTMRNGKTYLLSLGDIVTQYQNHTTHHRGQLSQLLDELGVEHDIGGLLVFAEETTA